MPTFLSDPTQGFYLVLIAAAVIAGANAARRQDRRGFVPFAVAAGVLLLVFLTDLTVETPREQVVRKTRDFAAALNDRDHARLAAVASDHFNVHRPTAYKKTDLPKLIELCRHHDVRVAVWDIDQSGTIHASSPDGEHELIVVECRAKAEAGGGQTIVKHLRLFYLKDPDGEYRLDSVKGFNYVLPQEPEPVPGLE